MARYTWVDARKPSAAFACVIPIASLSEGLPRMAPTTSWASAPMTAANATDPTSHPMKEPR